MVSKSLIHKKIYENIEVKEDLPKMRVDEIAQILIKSLKGIPNCEKYELTSHTVNFRNVMEGSRKDIIFQYKEMGRKPLYEEPSEYEGVSYGVISGYEQYERITKVDHVSFFTKIKDNLSEHRIYQIGARYLDKELYRYEDLRRNQEKEGDLSEAIDTLRKELEIDSNDTMKWIHLADLYYENEQFDKSIETCKKALKMDGRSSEAWNTLGMAYYKEGDVDMSISFLNKAIEEYSNFMKGFKNLARIYFEKGDYESALECCNSHTEIDTTEGKIYSKKVIEIKNDIKMILFENIRKNPEDTSSKFMIAEIYYNDEEFVKALQLFNDLIIKNSKYIDALVYKGLIHNIRKEYEHAITAYKLALNVESDNATILYNLGLVYNNKEDFNNAEIMLSKAVEIESTNIEFRHQLALTLLNIKLPNLNTNTEGLILDENSKKIYGEAIMSFFHKDFIFPMMSANTENQNFMNFAKNMLIRFNFEYEVYFGLEEFKQLVINNICNTQTSIHIILPLVFPEFLRDVSEHAYKKKEANFIVISQWDMIMYGEILSKIVALGNVQIRHSAITETFFGLLRDNKELILTPISNNLEKLLSIRIKVPEIIEFFKQSVFPISGAHSRPIG